MVPVDKYSQKLLLCIAQVLLIAHIMLLLTSLCYSCIITNPQCTDIVFSLSPFSVFLVGDHQIVLLLTLSPSVSSH